MFYFRHWLVKMNYKVQFECNLYLLFRRGFAFCNSASLKRQAVVLSFSAILFFLFVSVCVSEKDKRKAAANVNENVA